MKDKAIKVTLETVKASFVDGLKTYYSAKAKLTEAFEAAVPLIIGKGKSGKDKKKLRETLIQWGVDAGLVKGTVANTVSGLMLANGLAMRKHSPKGPSEEVLAAVAELMEFIGENLDEELDVVAVLRAALEQAKDKGAEEKDAA